MAARGSHPDTAAPDDGTVGRMTARSRTGGGRRGDDIVVATGLTDDQRDMVAANTGLIGFVLNRRAKHLIGGIYSEADAWQDGVFGLARAVQKFDPTRGYRFSTYALPHIMQAMQRGRGRCESKRWREAYAAQEAPNMEPDLSLDWEHTFGGEDQNAPVSLTLTLTDDTADTEGDAEAAAVVAGMRAACRDALDHAVLDALLAGAPTGPLGPRHGVSTVAAWKRANRLRAVGVRLYGEQAAA